MAHDRHDLLDALHGLSGDEAFRLLCDWDRAIDWPGLPRTEVPLADGALVRLDPRRRSASIAAGDGGVTVVDLGRRDRMRSAEAIVTPDLVRVDGPVLEVALTPSWGGDRGEISVRDPLDARGGRCTASVPVGAYSTHRYVDAAGRLQLLAVGRLDTVSGFGTFLTPDGGDHAHLRTRSGLAAFSDGRRVTFMRSVTAELAEEARAEGFAQVVTKHGPIGVLVDCGSPGDHLALAAYDARTGGTVGIVVDLRRPPVRDGAIVDPAR